MIFEENIDLVQNNLRGGKLTQDPHQCAEYVASLSGELSFYLSKQGEIEKERAINWLKMRKDHKSDTATTRAWELTKEGIEYQWYETRIKRIKALLTGLKTLIRMSELEIKNLSN